VVGRRTRRAPDIDSACDEIAPVLSRTVRPPPRSDGFRSLGCIRRRPRKSSRGAAQTRGDPLNRQLSVTGPHRSWMLSYPRCGSNPARESRSRIQRPGRAEVLALPARLWVRTDHGCFHIHGAAQTRRVKADKAYTVVGASRFSSTRLSSPKSYRCSTWNISPGSNWRQQAVPHPISPANRHPHHFSRHFSRSSSRFT
jgi:hypothetical protein